ncbi:MAG: glycosyltransferase family 4 protein [Planctomycetes bacterium]|nr:glycosyltransferase family 4 protein [Planctomycetota bacterium]
MKILILTDRFPPEQEGGAEASTFAIARGLVQAGCRVSVLTWTAARRPESPVEAWGMRIHRFHAAYPERFRAYVTVCHPPALAALGRALAAERPDVVQAHHVSNQISYAALSRCRRVGVPVVLTAHDPGAICHQKMICGVDLASNGARLSYEAKPTKCAPCMRLRWFPLRNLLIRRILSRSVDHLFANSRELKKILEMNGLGPFEVLHNPFLPELARAEPAAVAEFRATIGLAPDEAAIGGGGRMGFWKGTEHLIEAAGRLARRTGRPFRLVLAGRTSPEYESRLRDLAAKAGIDSRLSLAGWLEGKDLAAFYAACEVVAVSSIIPEALPRLAIEALAAGVPVVGSPYGGTPEIVKDGETGLLANPLVPDEFAAALARVLSNPVAARAWGERGRALVEKEFSVEGNVRRRLEVYERLLSTRRYPSG